MPVLWKKIEFYKEKSGDCNRNWGLRQSPGVVSGGLRPNIFNVFKAIKPPTIALKKLYSWSKKLHLLITNLFFLTKHNTTYKRLSHPVAFAVGQLFLWRDIYLCNILFSQRYALAKHGKKSVISSLQEQA